jgi:ribosomal protein S21
MANLIATRIISISRETIQATTRHRRLYEKKEERRSRDRRKEAGRSD